MQYGKDKPLRFSVFFAAFFTAGTTVVATSSTRTARGQLAS